MPWDLAITPPGLPRLAHHARADASRCAALRAPCAALAVCNEPQYASMPPAQIVPDLADRGEYLASESSFYRVLHAHQQVQRRGRARPPQKPRPVPRRRADGPNQLWSWDITYLLTSVRGVWLYLYLVVDVWSRKIMAWDIAEREEAQVAADLISRACMPTTGAPCARRRWRCGWRSWACCAPSRARGCRTTTPTPRRCSAPWRPRHARSPASESASASRHCVRPPTSIG